MPCQPYEQGSEWWDTVCESSGQRHADMAPIELHEAHNEASTNAWQQRRKTGRDLHPIAFGNVTYRRTKDQETPQVVVVHEPLTTDEKIERDQRYARTRQDLDDLRAKYDRVIKTGNIHEVMLAEVRRTPCPIPPHDQLPPKIGTTDTAEDAILAWADGHAGETVDPAVMDGLNAYGPSGYTRRMQYTVDKTLSLLFGNHAGTTFEHLFVFDLGDSVPGDALDDNKATNAAGVFRCCAFAAYVKARALTDLAAHVPVTYIGVPGNHGRRTKKMPWKDPTETADWLIYSMVADKVADNPNIEVVIPCSWSAVIEIRGCHHRLNHGYTAAKGGFGGVPWYGYMRRDGKMTAIEAGQGRLITYRWYGHIHTQAEIPKGGGFGEQFIVGSLMGGNEYAYGDLGEYSDPVQKLVGAHDKYGVTFRYPLNVKYADAMVDCRYDDALGILETATRP